MRTCNDHTQKGRLANLPDVLSVKQVCDVLSLSRNSVYSLLLSGSIRALRMTPKGKFIIPKRNVVAYLRDDITTDSFSSDREIVERR